MTEREIFWGKVETEGECLVWTGSKVGRGYGSTYVPRLKRFVRSHRYAYEDIIEPIPEGLVIDHLCRNRACVNPEHLEPVTNRENILRGISPTADNSQKTHCRQGHPFNTENTYNRRGKVKGRDCKPCHLEQNRRYYWRQKELLASLTNQEDKA